MKKYLSLALILLLCLTGCGSVSAPEEDTKLAEPQQYSYVPVVSSVGQTQQTAEAAETAEPKAPPVKKYEVPSIDEIYVAPRFSISSTDVLQGDAIAVQVTMNSAEGLPEIETTLGDAYFLPCAEDSDADYIAYIPIWYAQELGVYDVTVKAGESSTIYKVNVGAYEFGEQHMTISSSTVAATTGPDANADYKEKVTDKLSIHDDVQHWHGVFIQPVEARVSTEFGLFRYTNGSSSARRHTGIDLAAPAGTPVPASNAGRVIFAGEVIMTGNTVIIEHGGGLKTMYLHMSELDCEEGQMVEQGDIIGLVGSTGYSTGAHLHFEVRLGEYAINPWRLFDGTSSIYKWEDVGE